MNDLRAKLGANYTKASAAFIWATIARMYAARRSGLKKEMFGYVPGGYARILSRMQDVLQQVGVTVRLNSRVTSIRKGEHGVQVDVRFDQRRNVRGDPPPVGTGDPEPVIGSTVAIASR